MSCEGTKIYIKHTYSNFTPLSALNLGYADTQVEIYFDFSSCTSPNPIETVAGIYKNNNKFINQIFQGGFEYNGNYWDVSEEKFIIPTQVFRSQTDSDLKFEQSWSIAIDIDGTIYSLSSDDVLVDVDNVENTYVYTIGEDEEIVDIDTCCDSVGVNSQITYFNFDTINETVDVQLAITFDLQGCPTSNIIENIKGSVDFAADGSTVLFGYNTGGFGNTIYTSIASLPLSFDGTYYIVDDYDVAFNVGDCVYTFSGSTDIVNTNIALFYENEFVVGCTEACYDEFNPDANWDLGFCNKITPYIEGCTNPLSINYNPNATINDGSCTFISGCTKSVAKNYNPLAVIDDGSCLCDDVAFELDFNPSGDNIVLSGDCTYYVEFDMFLKIDCQAFLDEFEVNGKTVVEMLSELKFTGNYANLSINDEIITYTGQTIEVSGGTFITQQSQTLYEYDESNTSFGVGLFGNSGSCTTLQELVALELSGDCATIDESLFEVSWVNYKIQMDEELLNTFVKFYIEFEGLNYGAKVFIDNVKLVSICENAYRECKLIDPRYGFDLTRRIDNKKSWSDTQNSKRNYEVPNERLIFNTKWLDLHINPVKFMQNDVFDYYDKCNSSLEDFSLNSENYKGSSIDPKSNKWLRKYPVQEVFYEQYLLGVDCCSSKGVDYDAVLEIINKVDDVWYELAKELIPATLIWDESQFIIKNSQFHNPKFKYKRYGIDTVGGEFCQSGVTVVCTDVSKSCLNSRFEDIDDIFQSGITTLVCTSTGSTSQICATSFNGDGSFDGKLIQYEEFTGDTEVYLDIIDAWGYDYYDCVSGVTLVQGCIDENALNYNPNANVDDGSCIFEPVNLSAIYVCNESGDAAELVLSINGGTPPYQVIGDQNGAIISTGDTYSSYVVDSNGTVSNTVQGLIICPPPPCDGSLSVEVNYNCIQDVNGYNTGQGELEVVVGGGTPPYNISGGADGDIVSNGDTITIEVYDSNGCDASNSVEIVCPEPECKDISLNYTSNLYVTNYPLATIDTVGVSIDYEISNFPTNSPISNVTMEVSSDATSDHQILAGDPSTFNLGNSANGSTGTFIITFNADPVAFVDLDVEVTITLTNGCVFSTTYDLSGLANSAAPPNVLLDTFNTIL